MATWRYGGAEGRAQQGTFEQGGGEARGHCVRSAAPPLPSLRARDATRQGATRRAQRRALLALSRRAKLISRRRRLWSGENRFGGGAADRWHPSSRRMGMKAYWYISVRVTLARGQTASINVNAPVAGPRRFTMRMCIQQRLRVSRCRARSRRSLQPRAQPGGPPMEVWYSSGMRGLYRPALPEQGLVSSVCLVVFSFLSRMSTIV